MNKEINRSNMPKNIPKRKMNPNSLKNLKPPFQKGVAANPKGKAAGTLDEVTKFKKAIALFEKEQNRSIYKIILDKALRNPQVLVAIFKALIPQQMESNIKIENVNPYKDLTDDELTVKAYEIFNRPGTAEQRRSIN